MMIKLWCFVVIWKLACAFERQLNATVNPGCSSMICDNNLTISLVHVAAVGPYDVVHYVWDYTAKPSVLIAVTSLETDLLINCTKYCQGNERSISFSTDTSYNFSLILNNVIEYDDEEDSGIYNPTNRSNNIFNTRHFQWKFNKLNNTGNSVELSISSEEYIDAEITRKGLLSLTFKAFAKHGHDEVLPHLIHTANSSQVEMQLENLEMDTQFNNSRFAVEVLLVSPEDKTESMFINSKKNLDDEYAPGVFEVVELVTSKTSNSSLGGYIQYRPISYTSKDRQVANSSDINCSYLNTVTDALIQLNHSLAYSYYGHELNDIVVQALNVSFGTSGDGFYKKRNYTTWTFTVGYGTPPQQKFSLLVILVISIALGLPFLMMISGGIYFCCQHYLDYKRERLVSC